MSGFDPSPTFSVRIPIPVTVSVPQETSVSDTTKNNYGIV
jgi:hypothetical protein